MIFREAGHYTHLVNGLQQAISKCFPELKLEV